MYATDSQITSWPSPEARPPPQKECITLLILYCDEYVSVVLQKAWTSVPGFFSMIHCYTKTLFKRRNKNVS